MLNVKTYLGPSTVAGTGLFAGEIIKKGKVIWSYNSLVDITYSESDWKNLKETISEQSFERVQNYCYKEKEKYIVCTDGAQFMNHSTELCNTQNSKDLLKMFATRDIKKGEELFCDYFEYSDVDDHHLQVLK